ncbi:TrkH family potassium uptake protein [Prolixibacter sp. SD074]|uniref:TrkH family potassium uptake protein n=1 Tax=Prolixibacter sp. SD074 TaxID=2652391 RepID=UPI00127239BC|nr:TrkH family potassium uptake protein [Prolixibacter sp. SD074]GET29452.1 potassium transporter Trk [Prolixibacter sp. SD074]
MKYNTLPIVLKQVGSLLILLSIVVAVPGIVSLLYHEWYEAAGFFISFLVILLIGIALNQTFKKAGDIQYNHAMVVAASGWLAITVMGAIPFWAIAHIMPADIMKGLIPANAGYHLSSLEYFKNPLHCFFESMSAYTTTGLSMAVHVSSVGKGILFYRSLAQWVGGAGFIVMVLAVFRQKTGRGALLLYSSESTGERLKPKVIETARVIWKIYLSLTLFTIVFLIAGTLFALPGYPLTDTIFDAISNAMTGLSTGGFSTLDDSISGYHSTVMEGLLLLPMILGSLSIPFYYKVWTSKKISEVWKDAQTRALILSFFFGSIILSLLLLNNNIVKEPFRKGIFQFVSAISTTGWQTADISSWNWSSIIYVVVAAMFIGGAAGATVGGIKIIRGLTIAKGVIWELNKVFLSENTIRRIQLNGRSLTPDEMNEEFSKAVTIAILFFLFIFISSLVTYAYMGNEFSYFDSLFESTSAQCTVGLSTGITSPSMPPVLEVFYIIQMWAGRLEVIPVLAFFRALFFGVKP